MPRQVATTLRVERALLRSGIGSIASLDEVGRGALCGPVTVGAVLLTGEPRSAPTGVRDSKLVAPAVRRALVPKIKRWATAHAVGHASAAEIDRVGIIAALRLAGHRALQGLGMRADLVLLDGNHDYLTPPPQGDLLAEPEFVDLPPVKTLIKADLRCSGVAAASILAKTERDDIMRRLSHDFPAYGWDRNKGYAAAEHRTALAEFGPTPHHRVSWRLSGPQVD